MRSKPWCFTVSALSTNSCTSCPIFSRISPSLASLPQAFRPAISIDDTLGRALDTLYDFGVTALYGLIAATAATRLGLTRTFSHLDTTSFHVDGRYNSTQPPDEQVVHITPGYSRDHRPDLNQVMLE